MQTQSEKSNKALKDALLERIETEKVNPRSRWYFKGRECAVWTLWLLSVVVGALAVAVSLFVVVHGQYALYEATHENFFTFLVETLPYLWIIVFGLMVYVGMYNLRHTKRGYRYPLWVMLVSSLVLSFAGGSAMQFFGLGYFVDDVLGEHMELYLSQGKYEQRLWQDPDDGRLLGHQIYTTVSPTTTIVFEDTTGRHWRMDITELHPRDAALLAEGETVRLLGKATNYTLAHFHACGAFPWIMNKNVSVEELNEERETFIERVYEHARKLERPAILTRSMPEGDVAYSVSPQSICSTIDPVRRLPPR